MHEQVGWRGLLKNLKQEAPTWATLLPQFPRLLHRTLTEHPAQSLNEDLQRLLAEQQRQTRLLWISSGLLAAILAIQLFVLLA
jgi:ubiquinone biosynthesis protein